MNLGQLENEKHELQTNLDELLQEHSQKFQDFKTFDDKVAELAALKTDYDYSQFQIKEMHSEVKKAQ